MPARGNLRDAFVGMYSRLWMSSIPRDISDTLEDPRRIERDITLGGVVGPRFNDEPESTAVSVHFLIFEILSLLVELSLYLLNFITVNTS